MLCKIPKSGIVDCTGLRPTALATLPCRAGNKQGSRAFCGPPNSVRSSAGCERGHGRSRLVASRAHFCRVMLVPRRGSRVGAKHSPQLPEAAGETLRRLCWHCDLWPAKISAWCTQPALRHAQHPAINRVRLECSSILKRARPNLACPPAYNLKGPLRISHDQAVVHTATPTSAPRVARPEGPAPAR